MIVKIIPNDKQTPPGHLADAELHFEDDPLAGLKLIGFAIWERRGTARGGHTRDCPALGSLSRGCTCGAERPTHTVTFPARQYVVNGERRSVALLRPTGDVTANRIRDLILAAYAEHEASAVMRAAELEDDLKGTGTIEHRR